MPHALREALQAFRRAPLLSGLSAAMIGLSLFIVGLYGVAAHNVRDVLEQMESRVEVVAYLRDAASADAVRFAQQELQRRPEVKEVLYVSREQAMEIAKRDLGEVRTLLVEMESNPLPASIEIRMRPGHRDPETVKGIAKRVGAFEFVEEVQYGRDWLDKVHVLRRIAAATAMVMGVAFAAVAALIIGAAIRLAIFARRHEIAIMRLVGATDGFIRTPFLLEGLATGLIGALIAFGSTYATYRVLSDSVVPLVWLPDAWIVGGIAGGGLLGVVASATAVRRYLHEV